MGKSPNSGCVFVSEEKLRAFVTELFIRNGIDAESSAIISDNLVEAELRGVSSHGVMRCKSYISRIHTGQVASTCNIETIRDKGAMGLVCGNNFFGAVVGTKAMRLAIKKAKEFGIGIVCAQHSTHFGTCAYYAEMATREDLIAIVASNTIPSLPPMGGLQRKVGNNPLAFGIPAGKHYPIMLDFATSQVAMGKIQLAAAENRSIPLGWATDKDGNPTTNPFDALEGFMLPMGGPKGLGLAIAIDMITGVLAGSDFAGNVQNPNASTTAICNVGHTFIVIDPSFFLGAEDLKSKVDWYVDYFKDCPTNPSVDGIFMPGEIESLKKDERRINGIPLSMAIIDNLTDLGQAVGIPCDDYLS